VKAGVDLIQVRERDLDAAALAALVIELLIIATGTPTRIVVNDRIDVALACGADGVHLRGDSIPIASARRLAPAGFLIGRSVHGVREAIAAAGADYLIAGTVFPSASKPAAAPLLGLEGLSAIVRAVDRPVLAIGGVSGERIDEVAAAGAAGFAAIGLFMAPQPDVEAGACRAVELAQTMIIARSRFDRLNTTP
jgi:thiamine-phosphate pyrophosphorylase